MSIRNTFFKNVSRIKKLKQHRVLFICNLSKLKGCAQKKIERNKAKKSEIVDE